jgi:hypothetical protein
VRDTPRDYRTTGFRLLLVLLLVPAALVVWGLRLRGEARLQMAANERNASSRVKILAEKEVAGPSHGYRFKALESDRPGTFGFCAYPADYGRTGKWTFVINESGKLYRVDTGGEPIRRWAPDSTWLALD